MRLGQAIFFGSAAALLTLAAPTLARNSSTSSPAAKATEAPGSALRIAGEHGDPETEGWARGVSAFVVHKDDPGFVVGAKEKIASGLDVSVNQVFLTPDPTSARRLMSS